MLWLTVSSPCHIWFHNARFFPESLFIVVCLVGASPDFNVWAYDLIDSSLPRVLQSAKVHRTMASWHRLFLSFSDVVNCLVFTEKLLLAETSQRWLRL